MSFAFLSDSTNFKPTSVVCSGVSSAISPLYIGEDHPVSHDLSLRTCKIEIERIGNVRRDALRCRGWVESGRGVSEACGASKLWSVLRTSLALFHNPALRSLLRPRAVQILSNQRRARWVNNEHYELTARWRFVGRASPSATGVEGAFRLLSRSIVC